MILKCADFNAPVVFQKVPLLKNPKGNPGGKKRHYMALTCAFDIETTYLPEVQESIMYIWQAQLGEHLTVYGRTWDAFLNFMHSIKEALPSDRWLVFYVHNLSFEFAYLKGIYAFMPGDIFALASRKVLKCDMFNCFEFRCSYKLTNMSLEQFTEKMNVKHKKLSGEEFNYSKIRYPWTDLTEKELQYCVNDVQGLVEAVNALMARDGDTLQTIPLTSTGYVRREAKQAMRNSGNHHSYIYNMLPDLELYYALRAAFRGGNTHCSRFYEGDTVYNVHSADRSSSYPAVMCNCEYPMKFYKIAESDLNGDYIARCYTIRHKALLLRVRLTKLELKNPYWGCPYLTTDKCDNIQHEILEKGKDRRGKPKEFYFVDNGRIVKAASLETTITDVDLHIICTEYNFETIEYLYGWYASYEKLPKPLTDLVIDYYKKKTELKGVKGQDVYYDKAKALLNSLYGMMAQNPVKHSPIFQQVGDWDDDTTPDGELLEKYNSRAFLCYQWGVWVTAWSRLELEKGLRLVEEAHKTDPETDFIYCDTDSVKYTGFVDWSKYNEEKVAECLQSGAFATDPKGHTHYMGVFEPEDNPETGYAYAEFRSMGAKKYAFKIKTGEETYCTISGVNKEKGGKELDKHGGLEAFTEDFTFVEAGGTESVYSDDPITKEVIIDGHRLPITSNVSILPSTYTLGITADYERIIKYSKSWLENPYFI